MATEKPRSPERTHPTRPQPVRDAELADQRHMVDRNGPEAQRFARLAPGHPKGARS